MELPEGLLSQQLRELAGKATQGIVLARDHVTSPQHNLDRVKLTRLQHGPLGSFDRIDADLIAALWNNREALLTALELQERLDKPETVEVVAWAISNEVRDIDGLAWLPEAQAAINALKGGAQ